MLGRGFVRLGEGFLALVVSLSLLLGVFVAVLVVVLLFHPRVLVFGCGLGCLRPIVVMPIYVVILVFASLLASLLFGVYAFVSLERGFGALRLVSAEYWVGYFGVLIYVVGFALTIVPLVDLVDDVLLLVGAVMMAIALFRLGSAYGSTLIKVGSVLLTSLGLIGLTPSGAFTSMSLLARVVLNSVVAVAIVAPGLVGAVLLHVGIKGLLKRSVTPSGFLGERGS